MVSKKQIVFIIDDEPQVRDSLKWLFESVKLTVETYESADLFLAKFNNRPGCLILDVRLPGMSGLELLEQLKQQKANIPIIIITGHGEIQMAVRAMKSGAVDFILKPISDQSILEIVQNSLDKTSNLTSLDIINNRISSLSDREHQISQLILDGKLNKQIAYELSISISTVEAHRASIMRKMEAKNLAHFIKMYLQAQPSEFASE